MKELEDKFIEQEERKSGSKYSTLNKKKIRASIYNFVNDKRSITGQTEEPDIEQITREYWHYMKGKHGINWLRFLNRYLDKDVLVGIAEELYDKHDGFEEIVDETYVQSEAEEGGNEHTGGMTSGKESKKPEEKKEGKKNLKDWESETDSARADNGSRVKPKNPDRNTINKYAEEHGTTDKAVSEDDIPDVERPTGNDEDTEDGHVENGSGSTDGLSSWAERHGTASDIKPEEHEIDVNRIIQGDCKEVMMDMRANTVDMIITSPPYWAARAYEIEEDANWEDGEWTGQLGHEPTPEMFVEHLMEVMRACERVLKPTGTLWVNIDDTYGGVPGGYYDSEDYDGGSIGTKGDRPDIQVGGEVRQKDLAGVPERFVLAMQQEGWYRRNTIHWCKQVLFEDDTVRGATKPSAVKDRFVEKSVEYLYLFTPNQHYEFGLDDVRRPHKTDPDEGQHYTEDAKMMQDQAQDVNQGELSRNFDDKEFYHEEGGNLPTAWQVNPARSSDAHYAPFPRRLIERPIIAGCPPNGVVLDPFAGTGTTCVVAAENERNYIGIEMSEKYAEIARRNAPGSTQQKLI